MHKALKFSASASHHSLQVVSLQSRLQSLWFFNEPPDGFGHLFAIEAHDDSANLLTIHGDIHKDLEPQPLEAAFFQIENHLISWPCWWCWCLVADPHTSPGIPIYPTSGQLHLQIFQLHPKSFKALGLFQQGDHNTSRSVAILAAVKRHFITNAEGVSSEKADTRYHPQINSDRAARKKQLKIAHSINPS